MQTQDSSPEHAFTVDVPRGWTVKVGTFRLGYSEVRVMVDLKSPDGKTLTPEARSAAVAIPEYLARDPAARSSSTGEVSY
ncbi:MAG: hypothetical protein ACM3WP_25740 [Acidobacteriota bacterium]